MESEDKLLEEYRLGQEYVVALHEQIWQIGSILIATSLGTFAIIAAFQSITMSSLIISIVSGVISTSLLVIWYLIMERFGSFIRVSYYRLREIEVELGLWRNRYINYLDNPSEIDLTQLSEFEKKRLDRLQKTFRGKYSRIGARTFERWLIMLIPLVWASWIIYQVVVLFT